jgi:hypothetical protein
MDITFATAYLSRFLDKCTPAHLEAGKRVLRYLRGCPNLGITYKGGKKEKTLVFSDADHGSDGSDRKSTSGSLIVRQSGAIIWSCVKQSSVAQSSCEAEFYAAAETAKAALWLNKLLEELDEKEKLIIGMDNQAAMALIKQNQFYRRTKHIELKFYFLKDLYDRGEINVEYVPRELQRADWLTKPTNRTVFLRLRELSGLSAWPDKS